MSNLTTLVFLSAMAFLTGCDGDNKQPDPVDSVDTGDTGLSNDGEQARPPRQRDQECDTALPEGVGGCR